MANLVDKYLNKKKKQIYEYCKLINELLSYDSNQIWKTPNELNDILKDVISMYVDKYYFKTLENFDEYNEYLGPLIKCDNRFKTILVCSIESIPKELRIENYKISSYIMTLIVYTGVILDRFTYPYNNYKVTTKNISSIISPMFNSVTFVKYNEDSKNIREITSLVKKNDNMEKKFFDSLNELNTKESRNEYIKIDGEGKFYKVDYKYEMPELNEYRTRDIEKYFRRIVDDLNLISYELATLTALKIKMLTKEITILFPVNLEFYSNEVEISKLSRIIENIEVKKIIKLYVNYSDYKKHSNVIRYLTNAGFSIALNFDDPIEVAYSLFSEIKVATVNKEFLELNKGNLVGWENIGTSLVEKSININESISELQMLGLKEE